MLLVGIDVGGTQVKVGLIENGQIIRNMSVATNAFDVIKQLCNSVREILQMEGREFEELRGVAVGFPGMIIGDVVKDSPNIGLRDCNLKEVIEEELKVPVVVRNDANMAAIAEQKLGAGEGCKNMLYLSFGTGLGGGIVINGELYEGNGGAGEVGHIILEQGGKPCGCGRSGCAEQYVSMKALSDLAKEVKKGYPDSCVTENIDGTIYASELVRAYKRNDACAREVIDKYVNWVSQYLLNLCNLFRPEKIIIGGGITYAPEIIEMAAKACREASFGYKNSPNVEIVPAKLGNNAGILGAVVFFENESAEIFSNTDKDRDTFEEFVSASKTEKEESASNDDSYESADVMDRLESLTTRVDEVSDDGESEVVYDEALLNRVNEMLKQKD